MYALVFANGEFAPSARLEEMLEAAGLLVAADGGLRHLGSLGRRPDVIIGDLDSVSQAEVDAHKAAGVEVVQHPEDKDQTDLELALLHAAAAGAERIDVLGGLGRRWDHSIANLLLPVLEELHGCEVRFHDGPQTLFVVRERAELALPIGSQISLIPLGGDAAGVRTRGLRYLLKGETLFFGRSRGVSNVVVDSPVTIELETGTLLCVLS